MKDFITGLKKGEIRNVLILLATLFEVGLMVMLFFVRIPNANKDIFNNTFSMYTTAWVSAMAFFFGSSKTEADGKKADAELAASTQTTIETKSLQKTP